MKITHTYTLEDVVLFVKLDTFEGTYAGNRVSVTPIYKDFKGRKCNKIIHGDKDAPFIWWNAKKVFLDEYDVLSADELVKKYKEKTLTFDEAMDAFEKAPYFAILKKERRRQFLLSEKSPMKAMTLDEEMFRDLRRVNARGLKGRRIGNCLKNIDTHLRSECEGIRHWVFCLKAKVGCPIIVSKSLGAYKKKYLYVDDNFHLQESDKFPLKYLFKPFPKGLKDGGIVDKPKRFNYYI